MSRDNFVIIDVVPDDERICCDYMNTKELTECKTVLVSAISAGVTYEKLTNNSKVDKPEFTIIDDYITFLLKNKLVNLAIRRKRGDGKMEIWNIKELDLPE